MPSTVGAAAQCSCRVFSPSTLAWQRRLADSNLELLRINIENFINFWKVTGMLKAKLARMEFGLIDLMQRRRRASLNLGQQPVQLTIPPESQCQGHDPGVAHQEFGSAATLGSATGTYAAGTTAPEALMFGDWFSALPGGDDIYQNMFDNTSDPFPFGLDDLLAAYNT